MSRKTGEQVEQHHLCSFVLHCSTLLCGQRFVRAGLRKIVELSTEDQGRKFALGDLILDIVYVIQFLLNAGGRGGTNNQRTAA